MDLLSSRADSSAPKVASARPRIFGTNSERQRSASWERARARAWTAPVFNQLCKAFADALSRAATTRARPLGWLCPHAQNSSRLFIKTFKLTARAPTSYLCPGFIAVPSFSLSNSAVPVRGRPNELCCRARELASWPLCVAQALSGGGDEFREWFLSSWKFTMRDHRATCSGLPASWLCEGEDEEECR